MFFKSRKNASASNPGDLIYADTLPRTARKKPHPARQQRLTTAAIAVLSFITAALLSLTLYNALTRREDRYLQACRLMDRKDYATAMAEFEALGSYRDSQAIVTRLTEQQAAYDTAAALVVQQRYAEAITAFRALGSYADSAEQAAYQVTYQKALDLIAEIDVGKTQLLTRILTDQVRLTDENSYPTTVGYEVAAALLESLGDYKNAPTLTDRCYYSAGLVKLGWEDWAGALAYMEKMSPETAAEFNEEYQQRVSEKNNEEGP